MKFITTCRDESGCADFAIFDMTPEFAKMLIDAKNRLIELKKEKPFEDLCYIAFDATGEVRYFETGKLGDEGCIATVMVDGELKDLLTSEQRAEIDRGQLTTVSDDFKLYGEDDPVQPLGDPVFRWTECDQLILTEEFFYFRSFSGDYDMESEGLSFDVLSRVL